MVKITALFSVIVAATAASAFRLTAWQGTGFTGRAFQTASRGTHLLGFSAASYRWDDSTADGCCIKTCAGARETGSFCDTRSNPNVAPPNRFDKVVIGCGSDVLNC